MACKKCKKNALGIVKVLKNKFNGVKNEPKEKTPCEAKRKLEQDWLSDSVKGKKLSKMSKATNPQNIILTVFAWIPLTVGYVTIIRFVINLF
jgi:hypothetical protein|tara:strand:- start:4379 stop:4654 length:276 start_codon:yes stop_codon:yes gene_type:complete